MKEKMPKNSWILGLQHLLGMFGATVLVPYLTGMDTSLAILSAGVGTLAFHLCSKGIVPVFLGSSFAFIGAITLVLAEQGIGVVKGGIIGAGVIYLLLALFIRLWGVEKLQRLFPPVVIGPIIILIGLRLSPVAIQMAFFKEGLFDTQSLLVASVVIFTMLFISSIQHSFFRQVPILFSIILGYLLSLSLGIVDLSLVKEAHWFGLSSQSWNQLITAPQFRWVGLIGIAPIALVVFMEHIGDMTTNGAVVGKNFFKNPGLHRTMMGDGVATILAGFLGGPANTTYGENTGVLAVTKVYDPRILRLAAIYAILISFSGKISALIQSIPTPVMGGISIILFGMIAAIGVRNLVEAKLDFSHSRNLLIVSLTLVIGIGVTNINIGGYPLSGLTIASVIAIILHQLLPQDR